MNKDIYIKNKNMGNYIKTFESFSSIENTPTYESLFEELDNLFGECDNIFEASEEEWEEKLERPLSSGEKRALGRDFEIITNGQLAGMYLRALGAEEDNPNKYIHHIIGDEGINITDTAEQKKGSAIWTNAALADALGIQSFTTFYRTVNKFKNLLSGIGSTDGEDLYAKVIDAYEKFKNMNVYEIGSIAGKSLSTSTKLRDAIEAYASGKDKRVANKRMEEINVLLAVKSYEAQLDKAFPQKTKEEIREKAINAICKKYQLNYTKLKSDYLKFIGKES